MHQRNTHFPDHVLLVSLLPHPPSDSYFQLVSNKRLKVTVTVYDDDDDDDDDDDG